KGGLPVTTGRFCVLLIGLALAVAGAGPAAAELVVSDLVVELAADAAPRKDVEVWNNSDERCYVEMSPGEVLDPGSGSERRVRERDAEELGLVVSPKGMILGPQPREVVRIARLAPSGPRERVYRITFKPVVGEIQSESSGLKLLVGYDVLALVRPA